eukprot:SAG31_NODE_706_length_12688_cov_41.991342_2_plen_337_part_00
MWAVFGCDNYVCSSRPFSMAQVSLSPHPGSAIIELSDKETAAALAETLDGAKDLVGAEVNGLLALLESDAAPRRDAHSCLRDALRLLTGTRSFHNFCPHFQDASDPKSVRSVYRCRSGMTCGWHDKAKGRDFAIVTVCGRSFLYHQILSMMGLVIGVARGAIPLRYVTFALDKNRPDVEVPLAPASNLVLAECVFRDSAFEPSNDGQGAKRQNVAELTPLERKLRNSILDAVTSEAKQRNFDNFLEKLQTKIAPRLIKSFEAAGESFARENHLSGQPATSEAKPTGGAQSNMKNDEPTTAIGYEKLQSASNVDSEADRSSHAKRRRVAEQCEADAV